MNRRTGHRPIRTFSIPLFLVYLTHRQHPIHFLGGPAIAASLPHLVTEYREIGVSLGLSLLKHRLVAKALFDGGAVSSE